MNKMNTLVVAATVLAATFPALAVEPLEGVGDAPTHPEMAPAPATQGNASQRVVGTVSGITPTKGLVTLTSSEGTLQLHFPPASLRDVKKGDTITAHYALAKPTGPGGAVKAYDAPMASGEHRMSGTIRSIDHQKGWLRVKTDETTLVLRFPPQAVRDLKNGDKIVIDLAYSKAT